MIGYCIDVRWQRRLSQRGETAEDDCGSQPGNATQVKGERDHKRVGKARGAGTAVADSEQASRPYDYYKRAVFVNPALRYGDEFSRRFEGGEGGASDGAGEAVGVGVEVGIGVAVGVGVGVGGGVAPAAACFWYASQEGR